MYINIGLFIAADLDGGWRKFDDPEGHAPTQRDTIKNTRLENVFLHDDYYQL